MLTPIEQEFDDATLEACLSALGRPWEMRHTPDGKFHIHASARRAITFETELKTGSSRSHPKTAVLRLLDAIRAFEAVPEGARIINPEAVERAAFAFIRSRMADPRGTTMMQAIQWRVRCAPEDELPMIRAVSVCVGNPNNVAMVDPRPYVVADPEVKPGEWRVEGRDTP